MRKKSVIVRHAMLALGCSFALAACASSHRAAGKNGANDAGASVAGKTGGGTSGASSLLHDAGSLNAVRDAAAARDAGITLRDAATATDSSAPLSACAARATGCDPSHVDLVKTALGDAFRSCALAMTVMPCGVAIGTFDAEGCAETIEVKVAGMPNDDIAKCVVEKLADRRFLCAKAMAITFSASCT